MKKSTLSREQAKLARVEKRVREREEAYASATRGKRTKARELLRKAESALRSQVRVVARVASALRKSEEKQREEKEKKRRLREEAEKRLRQVDTFDLTTPDGILAFIQAEGWETFDASLFDWDGSERLVDYEPTDILPMVDPWGIKEVDGVFWACVVFFRWKGVPTDDKGKTPEDNGSLQRGDALVSSGQLTQAYKTSTHWFKDPVILDQTVSTLYRNTESKYGVPHKCLVIMYAAARSDGRKPPRL